MDRYTRLVDGGWTGSLATRLGLPRPAVLRRAEDGGPLVPGPVLVLGPSPVADAVAAELAQDQDVRRHADGVDRWGAVVLDLTAAAHPDDLGPTVLEAAPAVRSLARGGRVVVLSTAPHPQDPPAVAAARQGVDGLLRSVAKELRGGATANGVALDGPTYGTLPASAVAALRFFLSARSSFVDGQTLTVATAPRRTGGGRPSRADDHGPSVDNHEPSTADHGPSGEGRAQPDPARPLASRVAVVTGAARGIGAAIARTLRRDGATLVLVDVPAAGEQLTTIANELGGTALQLDITAEDAGDRILEHAVARHGHLDIVVHNAGITRDKLLVNMDAGRWDPVVAVNIDAQLRINDRLLASEAFTDEPRIVSVSSTSGIAGNRGQTNYATTKAGVIGMVRATSPLLAEVGGTANAVAPGFIETEMTARMPFATREVARRLNSLQQGGLPQDVAEAVAFLASPAAGGIGGQVLRVCGQNLVGA